MLLIKLLLLLSSLVKVFVIISGPTALVLLLRENSRRRQEERKETQQLQNLLLKDWISRHKKEADALALKSKKRKDRIAELQAEDTVLDIWDKIDWTVVKRKGKK